MLFRSVSCRFFFFVYVCVCVCVFFLRVFLLFFFVYLYKYRIFPLYDSQSLFSLSLFFFFTPYFLPALRVRTR